MYSAAVRSEFLTAVLQNPVNVAILPRAPELDAPDWWLTAGAVFQAVWNEMDGCARGAAIGPVLAERHCYIRGRHMG